MFSVQEAVAEENKTSRWSVIRTKYRSELGIGLVLVIFFILISILSKNFLTAQNLSNIGSQVAIYAILAIGQTFVMLTGGIDLSLGSALGISAISMGLVLRSTHSLAAGLVVCIIIGIVIGIVNGVLISYLKLPAFIATLGLQYICRGGGYLLCNGRSIAGKDLPESLAVLAKVEILPYFRLYYLVVIVLYIVMAWCLNNTKLGRYLYAIGSNGRAARLAGVNVKFYTLVPYVISGFFAAIAAIFLSSRLMGIDPLYGNNYEMETLAGVVIGGVAMTGGKGTLVGTAIGIVFMGLVKNGLDLMGVSPYWQTVAVGILIIGALLIDSISNMIRESRKAKVN